MKDASGPEQGLEQRCVMMPSTEKVKPRWQAWGHGKGGVGRGVRVILMVVRGEGSLDKLSRWRCQNKGCNCGLCWHGEQSLINGCGANLQGETGSSHRYQLNLRRTCVSAPAFPAAASASHGSH